MRFDGLPSTTRTATSPGAHVIGLSSEGVGDAEGVGFVDQWVITEDPG